MIPFRKSIGFRLLVIIFILLALPLLLDFFILVKRQYEQTLNDAKEHLIGVAQLRETSLSQIQPLNKPLLEVIAYLLGLDQDFPKNPNATLNEQLTQLVQSSHFSSASVLKITSDNHFVVIGSSNPDLIGKDFTQHSKFNDIFLAKDIEQGWTTYVIHDEEIAEPRIIVALTVYSAEQKPIGSLSITEDIHEKLKELLTPDLHPYRVNFAILLQSTIVLAAADPDLVFQHFLPLKQQSYPSSFVKEPLPTDETIGYPFFEFTWKEEKQVGYIVRIPGSNFSLLTYTSRDAIFSQPLINFFNANIIYIVILFVGGSIAYLLIRRMAKPIQKLSHVMQGIQAGDLNLRYQKDLFGYEINSLGAIFNEMVDTVIEKKHLAENERVKREKLSQEFLLAQQVQRSLLPSKMPSYPGVEIAETYIPAIEVGGDFYDVFVTEKQQLVLSIADASGKGVQACFYSLGIRHMLRVFAQEFEEVGCTTLFTNNLFKMDTGDTGMFITVLMGFYNTSTRTLHYSNYGHNPALVRRENGNIEILHHPGIAMGVTSIEKREVLSIQLNKGDTVVFYTDGITEAHDESYLSFGEKRLIQCLQTEEGRSASEVVEHIVDEVHTFVGNAPQHDDITLLVMKVID